MQVAGGRSNIILRLENYVFQFGQTQLRVFDLTGVPEACAIKILLKLLSLKLLMC